MTTTEKLIVHLLLNILGGVIILINRDKGIFSAEDEEKYFDVCHKTTKVAKQLIERC